MPFIFAAIAGFLIGAGVIALVLRRRWQLQVAQAEQSLQEIAAQFQTEQAASRALKQEMAGLKFQLNQAQNDLRAAQAGHAE